MHKTINKSLSQLNSSSVFEIARKNPINAKGIAKMVWANNTREKYFFMNKNFQSSRVAKLIVFFMSFKAI
jgi:hypothetical protein